MAVSTTYQPLLFNGNGSTTAFAISWQFFDADDLTVIAIDGDGVETVKTLSTHYTVSGGVDANGLPATGTVTMLTAPATGTQLRVERRTDQLQSTVWTISGPFQAKSVEAGLDRVTLIAQESGGGNSGLTPKIDGDALLLETSGATDYYDAGAYPVRSSATPSDGDDLVNKTYADTLLDQGLAILADTQDEVATAVSAAASATSSASAASAAQSAAEAALDSLDDRYLGAKATDPLLDNDGDALAVGALYFNTGANILRAYTGSAWQDTISTSAITANSTATLSNKSIALASNTVTGTTAEFNAALSDGAFATLAGAETLTNKTVDSASNTLTVDLSEATVTGTAAEFDAACSNDNFLFESDLTDIAAIWPGRYGAVGDGSTDDTANFQTAINAVPAGGILDGQGKTYRIDSTLTLKGNMTLRNAVFDFSNAGVGDILFEAAGTLGADVALTASATAGSSILSVASATGLAVGDYLVLSSSAVWSSTVSATTSQIVRIKSISSLDLTLAEPLDYTFSTGDSAKINKLTTLDDLRLDGVRAFGSGPGTDYHRGLQVSYTRRLVVRGCDFQLFDDRCIQIATSIDALFDHTTCARATRTGLAYGIAIVNGCERVTVRNCAFDQVRHGVTIGGSAGVNRHITVRDSICNGATEAGFDAHPAADFVTFENLTTYMASTATGDGIISQGATTTIRKCQVNYAERYGIIHQNLTTAQNAASIISENRIVGISADAGIYVVMEEAGSMRGVLITDNVIVSGFATGVYLRSIGGNVSMFRVSGNQMFDTASTRGIYVQSASGYPVEYGTIAGNTFRIAAAGNECIYLNAAVAGQIEYIAVTGNTLFDGSHGVRGINTNRINTLGNVVTSAATAAIAVAGAQSADADNITS